MNTKKHILSSLRFFLLIAVPLLFFATNLNAAGGPPAGYYSSIEGLQGESLKTTLGTLTRHRFTTLYDYGSGKNKTWQGLWQTDRNTSDNSVIDMYSTVKRYFNPSDTTASVTNCDIEHMFPNSWWGAKAGCKEAYCDLHHLVPADYSANRSKSNNGPGVPTDTTFNNGVWVNGKDAARDNIIVFCPPDEYKGDFARALMYIAMTYGDTVTWQTDNATPHMDNDSWQEFKPATSALLLAWHRADPVSDKERERMEAVYRIQHNRNPFIDYPCLAEYIWGDKVGTAVSMAALTCAYDAGFVDEGCTPITTPFITSPYGTVHVGSTKTSVALNYAVKVRGINLTNGDLTLSLSGANAGLFSLSTTSVSKTDAEAGYDVTITYTPTGVGEHTATLTISGCGVTSQTVTITGTCATYYTATWKTGSTIHATTDAPSGTSPDLPEKPGDCTAPRVFVGWTAQESVSNKPADLFTEQAPALTSNKTFYAVYADATPGDLDAGSEVYTFTSKSWEAEEGDWTSGKNGYGFSEEQGVQVSGSVSGANATCPNSYNDIRTVVVTYSTNKSSGAGDIVIAIDGTTKTNGVSYSSGGQTLRDSKFDFTAAPKNGAVKITVNQTGGSIYIKSITINHGTPTTYSDYSLSCGGEAVEVTATFKNGTATYATKTGLSGTTIDTPADPMPCGDYTFDGWSTHEYGVFNTAAPEKDYTGYFALTDKTYHAVYTRTDSSGSGSGASAGTTLWKENFETFGQDSIPTAPGSAATVYGSATITYTCSNGTNATNTRVYNAKLAGGSSPEMLIVSNNGSFTISGIPTGNASLMTLTFKSNKSEFSITSGTSNISVGAITSADNTITCDISNVGNATFDLTITNTNTGTTNARVDNFSLIVKTAAAGSGSTYHTTAPDCEECTPVTATGGFANASVTTACDGVVSNPFTANSDAAPAYSSSDETVATVNAAGEVTILKTGATTITAVVAATKCFTTGVIDTYTLTVNKSTPAATFVSPTTSITIGQSTTNTLTTPSDGAITYASDNTAVATVNASTGAVTAVSVGSARITATVTSTNCYNATSAYYDLTVNDYPKYSLTFMNNGAQFTKVTDYAGETVPSIGTPTLTNCPEYTFIGWSSSEWAQDNTIEPATGIPATFPSNNVTYYAVYRHVVGSGSVKDTTITETCAASSPFLNLTGWTTTVTEVYNSATYCGAAVPALKFNASDQYLQSATLNGPIIAVSYLYRPYNTSAEGTFDFYVSTNGTDFTKLPAETVSYSGTNAKTTKEITLDASDDYRAIKIVFTKTASNVGVDDIFITYKKPSDSASTYYTTSPDCGECTYLLTVQSEDDTKGTAAIE